MRYRAVTSQLASDLQDAKKILLLELGGLGDLVHSLPALWALRQQFPRAELHCLVQAGNASLLRLTPWIDRVIPYQRGGNGSVRHHLATALALRARHYDLAVDFMGADYSAAVAGISRARRRLMRHPGPSRFRIGWQVFSTDVMECSFHQEPMYLQKLSCLEQAGVERPASLCSIRRDPSFADNGVSPSRTPYLHVSPYTKLARKELPPERMAELLVMLQHRFPRHQLVLSSSNKARERALLDRLLAVLPFQPAAIYPGTLNIPELYALIEGADLHLGGDSGAMHLAWLAGTPSVAWFRDFGAFGEWVPQGSQYAIVRSSDQRTDQLHGIDLDQIVDQAERVRTLPRTLPGSFH